MLRLQALDLAQGQLKRTAIDKDWFMKLNILILTQKVKYLTNVEQGQVSISKYSLRNCDDIDNGYWSGLYNATCFIFLT